jgi:hypothetical protein
VTDLVLLLMLSVFGVTATRDWYGPDHIRPLDKWSDPDRD